MYRIPAKFDQDSAVLGFLFSLLNWCLEDMDNARLEQLRWSRGVSTLLKYLKISFYFYSSFCTISFLLHSFLGDMQVSTRRLESVLLNQRNLNILLTLLRHSEMNTRFFQTYLSQFNLPKKLCKQIPRPVQLIYYCFRNLF